MTGSQPPDAPEGHRPGSSLYALVSSGELAFERVCAAGSGPPSAAPAPAGRGDHPAGQDAGRQAGDLDQRAGARELELLVARDARYEEAQRRAVELMAASAEHGGRNWRREDLYEGEGPWSTLG